MNTKPRPAVPGGVSHVARMLTLSDATTLTMNVAEHALRPQGRAPWALGPTVPLSRKTGGIMLKGFVSGSDLNPGPYDPVVCVAT